jgi:hypothetical protein
VIDERLIRRAQNLAARVAVEAYLDAFQKSMQSLAGDCPRDADEPYTAPLVGMVHRHEAIALGERNDALLVRSTWEFSAATEELLKALAAAPVGGVT